MIIAVQMSPLRTLQTVLVLAAAALVALGCGSTVQDDTVLTVHLGAGVDSEVAEGARVALDEAGGEAAGATVELVPAGVEPGGDWRQAELAAAARVATQDSTAIAFIGEQGSAGTRVSAPITNEAGLLQVAPGEPARILLAEPGGNDVPRDVQPTGERTLGAIAPSGASPHELGHAAMVAVLEAIDDAEDPLDRSAVINAFLSRADPTGVVAEPGA